MLMHKQSPRVPYGRCMSQGSGYTVNDSEAIPAGSFAKFVSRIGDKLFMKLTLQRMQFVSLDK